MVPGSQREPQAADGPPCTFTISGYFFCGSKSLGNISQPCTRVVPFIQWILRISPHAGFIAAFSVVSCFHCPIGPAQISDGTFADWRTIATVTLSLAELVVVAVDTQKSLAGRAVSSPVQMVCIAPPLALTLAKPELPSTFSPKVMRPEPVHASANGDALMLGVTLRAAPPAIGTTKTSPPVEPSSLINPSMNATFLPSGETRGFAI